MQTAVVTIGAKTWAVDVAATSAEITQGLSGVASIPVNTGMLFDMGGDLPSIAINSSEMLFNLDIIFINSTLGVVGILTNVSPADSVTFELDVGARYFLEVNTGEALGMALGESVDISGYTPSTGLDITGIINLMITVMIVVMMMKSMSGAFEGIGGK